jgi:hypothetical protein
MQILMKSRLGLLLGQLALLVVALVIAVRVAEIWLFGVIVLIETFGTRPVLASGIVLLICVFLFLCIRGAGMASRPGISFPSRAVLLLVSAIAAAASLELIYFGLVSFAGEGWGRSWEDYFALGGGILLVAVAAAGIAYAFGWRYWITLAAAVAAVAVAILAVGSSILFA